MSPLVRVLVMAAVRLGLLFYAGWFAFAPEALGEGTSMVSRIGLVLVCLMLSILLGEIDRLRTHFSLLVGALRSAGGGSAASQAAASVSAAAAAIPLADEGSKDPKASVEILIRALAAPDLDTVSKAHKHLQRLTGKDLPPEHALWQRWWQENRDDYAGPPTGTPGNIG